MQCDSNWLNISKIEVPINPFNAEIFSTAHALYYSFYFLGDP